MHRSFLIKPASSACNLRCRYCFYIDESENRSVRNYGMMDEATSHALIDKAAADRNDFISFGFQGGEPTLAGLDFFRDFVSYTLEKTSRRHVNFAIQTNGILINREWAEFLKKNDFLVGVSIDGAKKFHDSYRVDASGKGSFTKVFNNAKMLQSEGVAVNILITVTKQIARNVEEVYSFFKRNGFRYHQYIPCIDPLASRRGEMEYSLTSEDYAVFLDKLFALYYRDWKNQDYVSIRYFDNLVNMCLTGWAEECGMNGVCGNYYVIEADGSVYPCDFYVLDDYRLGNIRENSFDQLDDKRRSIKFIEESMSLPEECQICSVRQLCRGGCKRDRENFAEGRIEKTYLCSAYKHFFTANMEKLMEIVKAEHWARNGRQY